MLITTKELADKLGVIPETVLRMVRKNKIPYLRWGGKSYRYDLEAVLLVLQRPSK